MSAQQRAHRAAETLRSYVDRDSDVVSCFVFGDSWEDADGAVFVVKGSEAARYFRDLAYRQGLTTNKPIAEES